jgi:WD40 repeat protein
MNFANLDVEHVFETCDNDSGLMSINNDPSNFILAIPGKIVGYAILCNFERNTETSIKAHKTALSLLEISNHGHKLATASDKGIRIYNTKNGEMVQ